MKPTRIRMCHSLVMNYGLYKKMEIFVSEPVPRVVTRKQGTDEIRSPLTRSSPTARETGNETGNVTVPYRRVCRVLESRHAG